MATFEDRSDGKVLPKKPKGKQRSKSKNEPAFDSRSLLNKMLGVDLTTIARKLSIIIYTMLKPKLCFGPVALTMDVRWLNAISRAKEEAIWTVSEYSY